MGLLTLRIFYHDLLKSLDKGCSTCKSQLCPLAPTHPEKGLSKEAIQEHYLDFYREEPLVHIKEGSPSVRDVVGKPIVEVR